MSDDDMNKHVILLSEPVNFAVVQLPERKFPGVVCQGDTLHSLVQELELMLISLKNRDFEGLESGIDLIRMQLLGAQSFYESVCKAHEIDLPYPK